MLNVIKNFMSKLSPGFSNKGIEREKNISAIKERFSFLFDSMALAEAFSKCIANYQTMIEKDEVYAPAHMRWGSCNESRRSLYEIWEDIALEQITFFWHQNNGMELMLNLTGFKEQNELIPRFAYLSKIKLSELNRDKSKYDNAIQTAIKVLANTRKLWEDNHPESSSIKESLFTDDFIASLERTLRLKKGLKNKEDKSENYMKNYKTLLEIVWEEVVRLSKDIALYSVFGSQPKKMIADLARLPQSDGISAIEFWSVIENAKKPEDLDAIY